MQLREIERFLIIAVFRLAFVAFQQASEMNRGRAFGDKSDLFVTLEAEIQRNLNVLLGVKIADDELELFAQELDAGLVFRF